MRIAVYCSARTNIASEYHDAATVVGHYIGRHCHTLVYGGLALGLMDTVSRAANEAGAHVIGVVPESRVANISPANDETITVAGLHERKAAMIDMADAFVVLPGGYGTLDELLSTLAILRFVSDFSKPIIVVNIAGLFNPLLQQLRDMVERQLLDDATLRMIQFIDDADGCCRLLDVAAKASTTT
jgi:hypothetical protein